MPGKQVKNWRKYEALRQKGFSAKIANAGTRKRKK